MALARRDRLVLTSARRAAGFVSRYVIMGFSIAGIMLQGQSYFNLSALAIGLTAALAPTVPTLVYFATAKYTVLPSQW